MDKDRILGGAKQTLGSIKTAAGKALHDPKLIVEGVKDQAEGKIQSTLGEAKDTLADAERKVEDLAKDKS